MKHLKTYEELKDFFKKHPFFAYPNDSDKQYWNLTQGYNDLILKYNRIYEDPDFKMLYFIFKSMHNKGTKKEGTIFSELNFSEKNWQRLRGKIK
jgi:hypothetical protein